MSGPSPARPHADRAPAPAAPRWQASQLLQRQREVEIEHGGQIYRLRLTAQGKLILTK